MFGWVKKRNALDNRFSEFVRPELVEALQKPEVILPLNEFRIEEVSYLLVAVDGDTPREIGENIGRVADLAHDGRWYADSFFSNLAVLVDGVGLPRVEPPISYSELAASISTVLGMRCKSLGGESLAPCGDFGSARRRAYGAQIPGFLALVSQLETQPFGEHTDANRR
jgi:hypothetical protein